MQQCWFRYLGLEQKPVLKQSDGKTHIETKSANFQRLHMENTVTGGDCEFRDQQRFVVIHMKEKYSHLPLHACTHRLKDAAEYNNYEFEHNYAPLQFLHLKAKRVQRVLSLL